MASISYDDAVKNSFSDNNIEWFSLKNNGDEAIVRFMHDSTADFDIVLVHELKEGDKYLGKVNCLRNPGDPVDVCPLCATGKKLDTKFFIHLIKYENENGVIVGKPMVWERSLNYADRLKGYLVDYGPLSNCLFKVRRNGAAGDKKTTYDINPCFPQQYPPEMYPIDTTAFEGFKAENNMVMTRSFEDLYTFVMTGKLPQKEEAATTTASTDTIPEFPNVPLPQNFGRNVPPAVMPNAPAAPVQPTVAQVQYTQPYQTVGSEMNGTANLNPYAAQPGVQAPVVDRPVRSY